MSERQQPRNRERGAPPWDAEAAPIGGEAATADQPAAAHAERADRRPRPMVWIACLAAYADGQLHGAWVDAAVEDDELAASARRVLASSPIPGSEEWAIFEHDLFGPFRVCEQTSMETVARVARGIRDHGHAFAAWAQLHDGDPDLLDRFSDAYLGHYESPEDWAQQVVDDLELDRAVADLPDTIRPYVQFDHAAWARDARLSGEVHYEAAPGGGVYIFLTRSPGTPRERSSSGACGRTREGTPSSPAAPPRGGGRTAPGKERFGATTQEGGGLVMKTLAIRLDDELHARLSMLSKLSGTSVTDTIRIATEKHLDTLAADPAITAKAEELTVEIEKEAAQQREALAALIGTGKPAPKAARGGRAAK